MMYFYVPNRKKRVFDRGNNPIQFTPEDALKDWNGHLKTKSHIRLFDSYDNAVKYALFDIDKKISQHSYPIFQVEVINEEQLSATEEKLIEVSSGSDNEGEGKETVVAVLNSFNTSCDNAKAIGFLLSHIRSDLEDITFPTKPLKVKVKAIKSPEKATYAEETGNTKEKNIASSSKSLEIISNANEGITNKPDDLTEVKVIVDKNIETITVKEKSDKTPEKTSDSNEEKNKPSKETEVVKNLKTPSPRNNKMAVPLLVTLGGATGFYFSGSYPVVATLLARAGLVLPTFGAASMASQVMVGALAGAITYGIGLGLWRFGTSFVNHVRNIFARRKTKKESYEEELKENIAEVSKLESELGLEENDEIVVHLKKLLDNAPMPSFDKSGDFKEDTGKHKNSLLAWELENLRAYQRAAKMASNDDRTDEKAKVIANIKKGPNF